MANLVEATCANWKTINRALKWLQDAGLISVEKRPGRTPNYTLNFGATCSKIGGGQKQGNAGNFLPPPSKNTTEPPPKLEGAEPPPKMGMNPLQKWSEPPPNLEDKQDNGIKQDITPYSPPQPENDLDTIAGKVIEHLNAAAGKNYRNTKTNRENIVARLREGFTQADCHRVIANTANRWRGTTMAQYLRPSTLFRPSKFEGYLNDNGETGDPNNQPAYDPQRTDQMIRELYGDDDEQTLLPHGGQALCSKH